jgi:DNA-binding transcriptional ArsR family regulator
MTDGDVGPSVRDRPTAVVDGIRPDRVVQLVVDNPQVDRPLPRVLVGVHDSGRRVDGIVQPQTGRQLDDQRCAVPPRVEQAIGEVRRDAVEEDALASVPCRRRRLAGRHDDRASGREGIEHGLTVEARCDIEFARIADLAKLLTVSLGDRYKALADPTRREILRLLRDDDMTAGEIAERFDISWPSISRHLSLLAAADLVTSQREGSHIRYQLASSVLDDIVTELADLARPKHRRAKRKEAHHE